MVYRKRILKEAHNLQTCPKAVMYYCVTIRNQLPFYYIMFFSVKYIYEVPLNYKRRHTTPQEKKVGFTFSDEQLALIISIKKSQD